MGKNTATSNPFRIKDAASENSPLLPLPPGQYEVLWSCIPTIGRYDFLPAAMLVPSMEPFAHPVPTEPLSPKFSEVSRLTIGAFGLEHITALRTDESNH
jgi:hypothetical protein